MARVRGNRRRDRREARTTAPEARSTRWSFQIEHGRVLAVRALEGERVVVVVGRVPSTVDEATFAARLETEILVAAGPGEPYLESCQRVVLALGGELEAPVPTLPADWPPPPPGPPDLERSSWRRWVFEAASRGHAQPAIVGALRELGRSGLREPVEAMLAQPRLDDVLALARERMELEALIRHRRATELGWTLEERTSLTEAEFLRDHWAPQRPVVLRGAAARWGRWSWDGLREAFGHRRVQATRNREGIFWRDLAERAVELPFAELIAEAHLRRGNHLYAVARNALIDRIPELRDAMRPLPGVASLEHVHLWVGPAGTVTPLHYDQGGAWQVQRIGRKRVLVASPFELPLLETAVDRYYNSGLLEPGDPTLFDRVRSVEVVLEPDDAIFVPPTCWHRVEALEPSISVAITSLVRPNPPSPYRR